MTRVAEDYLELAKGLLDAEVSGDDPNAILYLLLLDIATNLRAIAEDVSDISFKGS